MSHDWCPPSRRGHTWCATRAANAQAQRAGIDPRAARVCKRCGQLGSVNSQGSIRPVEAA